MFNPISTGVDLQLLQNKFTLGAVQVSRDQDGGKGGEYAKKWD